MKNIQAIDNLILEVLQEKFNLDRDEFDRLIWVPQNVETVPLSQPKVFNKLASTTPPEEILTDKDIMYYYNNPQEMSTDIQARLIAITKSKNDNPDAVELKDLASQALQNMFDLIGKSAEKKQTVSAPEFRPQRGEVGSFSPDMIKIINNVFSNTPVDFKARMDRISEISQRYYKLSTEDVSPAAILEKQNISATMSEILLLDVLNHIVKNFDAGSGAYLFEYFLAMIANGNVEGKSLTDKARMGAVDFKSARTGTSPDGEPEFVHGSAKYYQKGSGITQALDGFPYNKVVQYIVAIKKQGAEQVGDKSRGTSDPDRIMALDIYSVNVLRKRERVQEYGYDSFKIISGGKETDAQTKGNKLDVSAHLSDSFVNTIYISRLRTDSFREMIDDAIGNVGGAIQETYKALKSYYDSITEAKSNSKQYVADGDLKVGMKVFENLNSATGHFQTVQKNIQDKS